MTATTAYTKNLTLPSATVAGTTTYSYDGGGQRLSSTTGGGADVRYVWDPLARSGIPELALERTTAGSLVRRYVNGPLGAISFVNGSGAFYFHEDPLGTITDVTDATGSPQWRYEYEAYGATRTATNVSGTAPENRLRFNGQYLDVEIDRLALRAREYDPEAGRFSEVDPIDGPLFAPFSGAYAYADAKPTTSIDPTGLFGWPSWDDVKHGVGKAKDFGVGAGHVASETAGALEGFGNPINLAVGTAHRVYDIYRGCRSNGFMGCVNAGNEAFNPAYSFLVSLHGCRNSADAEAAGYYCTATARDAALLFLTAMSGRCLLPATSVAAKAGSRAWPSTAKEMDEFLGVPGTRIPDGPMTPGRNKVVWKPNDKTTITFEQHPYHPNAPDWHRGPHWHLDTPGKPHQRYMPGDPIPGYRNP